MKLRSVMKQRRHEELEWDAAHPDTVIDEARFMNEIMPKLNHLSLSQISAATGLSQQYCSLIRRGLKVPHRRHWSSFKAVTQPSEHD